MEELIIRNNDEYVLANNISQQLADFERKVNEIKEQEEKIKQTILNEMESKNILGLESDDLKISYVAPTTRETFDSKTFKEENRVIYDEYVKITPVKSSIRIKLK